MAWPQERCLGSIDELLEIGSPDKFEKQSSRDLQSRRRPQPNAELYCHVVGSKSKGSIERTFLRARAHCRRRRQRASPRSGAMTQKPAEFIY